MRYDEIVKQFHNDLFGTLTIIRSFKDPNKLLFLGAEIQEKLGHSNLTKAIKDAKLHNEEKIIFKKINNPNFFNQLTNQSLVSYGKFSSSITLISESGFYKLIMRSNMPNAEKFANWVTEEVLPSLRIAAEKVNDPNNIYTDENAEKHLDVNHQKYESKRINAININNNGVKGGIDYNRKSCVDHSGVTPSKLKKMAIQSGIPYKHRTSGKEILRYTDIPTACAMSLTDNLVSNGTSYEKAIELVKFSKVFYGAMIGIGVIPKELGQ